MLCHVTKEGKNIADYLEEILAQYGYYDDNTVSIDIPGLQGQEVMKKLMDHYRKEPRASFASTSLPKQLILIMTKLRMRQIVLISYHHQMFFNTFSKMEAKYQYGLQELSLKLNSTFR